VGFRFNSDGSLALDETRLRDALESNFSSVAGLLLGDGVAGTAENITAGDPRVAYTSKTVATEAGTYAVTVTSLGSQGSVVGGQVIDSLSQAETLTITYGSQVTLVNLVAGDTLATILSRINAAFASGGVSASANNDGTGKIRIATSGYGSSESITVVSSRGNLPHTTGFGTTPRTGTGSNIAGTINGHAAVGAGLTLTGATGYAEDGLRLTIAQTTIGDYGSVTYTAATPGEEGESILVNLRSMLKSVTDPLSGPIHNATDSLNNTIDDIEDRISAYEERLEIRREQLLREFSRADQALRLLTVAQNSLDNQLASLSQVK
jgi:flagellar hook-associated protein 2